MSDKNQAETYSLSGQVMTREGAYDSLHEVLKMKTENQISSAVDTWIAEEDLPVHTHLKVIKKNDPDYGLSEDEIQDRNEFIRWYLRQDFGMLTMIPKQDEESGFFIGDYGVDDEEYSAVNTMDFHRLLRPFNKYHYAMKKIMERVKDLAIMHSSISDEEGRLETYRRYEALVDREFRHRLLTLAGRHKGEADEEKRYWMKRKIVELSRRILDCKRIWAQYAPPENWDR